MKNIDVEVYISQMINFFEKNPGDFMDLVGDVQKEEFYSKLKEKSFENIKNGDDYILTKHIDLKKLNVLLSMIEKEQIDYFSFA